MAEVTDPGNWDYLKKKIRELGVFECHNYSDSFLQRRVGGRVRLLKFDSYLSYLNLLKSSKEEQTKLKKDLTINVTHFFRDVDLYNSLKEKVFPKMINEKHSKDDMKIRIWSAGCSSGEEAYSIAILLTEILGDKLDLFDIKILGMDIDGEIIKRAKAGVYAKHQFRETPEDYISRYFKEEEGHYVVADSLRRLVSFKEGDLFLGDRPQEMDIIFCRNTVIYFDDFVKRNFYVDVYDLLNKGGLFILGKTEILMGPAREMFEVFDSAERIYRRG